MAVAGCSQSHHTTLYVRRHQRRDAKIRRRESNRGGADVEARGCREVRGTLRAKIGAKLSG
eukprot:15275263-Alexandrium_andersonii.AAC.1